ncbi:MAG: Fe-S cluster assembly protein SufD [Gammaproteobacteria bacterium]|nr:Fe-S cluster assembly protein SufD [Gammaproteobacteria bacterium]
MTRKISPMARQAVDHYITQSELLNNGCESDIVVEGRRRAQAILTNQGFPTQKDEDWQYTKLTGFVQERFNLAAKTEVKHQDIHALLPDFAVTKIVFVDGWFDEALSDDLSALPAGVSLESTRDTFEISGGDARLYAREEAINAEPFGVLNNLFLADGFYLQVSRNVTVSVPVFVLYLQTQQNQISTLRNQIILEENSELTLVEQYVSLPDGASAGFKSLTNVVTEISVAKSARMKQVIVQQQAAEAYYFNNQFIFQADKSVFNTFYAGMGSKISRHQNHLRMDGEHIENSQNSACLAHDGEVVDSRTETQHNQVWGVSKQLHKYVLSGSAEGVFNGMIRVDQQAQKTDGNMDNKNLLLSESARMNTKPQLEIYADDVRCTHGSATGQINEDQIFYLQARGIPRKQAIEMITQAFLMEPAEQIDRAEIQAWVKSGLNDALQALQHKTLLSASASPKAAE